MRDTIIAQPLTVFGGVGASTAAGRGLAGFVTDGAIRDTDEIQKYGFPVRYAFSGPRAMRKQARLSAGRPVRFGDVEVAPGDIVVGCRLRRSTGSGEYAFAASRQGP
ncbi:RraA family protein [Streptomyces sp. NPDC051217]|uniref:RraA family protein n=1 Tax=Streptomyces sp. NPDC051217 TaxID=3365644 RepID=UPI0037A85136